MNIQDIDLNLLSVFDALLRDRNVTAAGARLGLSQPTMSHALNRLRKLCGDPLFVRTTHGMQPTPHALQIAEPIQNALETIRASLDRGLAFDPATSTRSFKLLMTDIGETVFLPRLMARLREVAPGVSVVASQILRDEYRDALQSGTVDLALGQMPSLLSGFYQQRLFEAPYGCLMNSDHPRIGKRLTLAQYLAESHVQVSLPGNLESVVDRTLARRRTPRRVALTLPHYLAVPVIVGQTDLLATVPRSVAEVYGDRERFRLMDLPFAVPGVVVRQFWHERFHHDAGNRWLRGVIAALFHAD